MGRGQHDDDRGQIAKSRGYVLLMCVLVNRFAEVSSTILPGLSIRLIRFIIFGIGLWNRLHIETCLRAMAQDNVGSSSILSPGQKGTGCFLAELYDEHNRQLRWTSFEAIRGRWRVAWKLAGLRQVGRL